MQPDRQIVFITGATGAIGKAIAENIATDKIYHVVLVVRDEKKAVETADKIRWKTGNENVEYAIVDLSDHKQIYGFAGSWKKSAHILINNAAATPRRREENKYGIELQFATNVLGYFSMMEAFTPHLSGSQPTRIINVASYWAGGLDLSDLEFKNRPYDNDTAYRQSKQANRMLSVAFADRLRDQHIFVNACHPGDVNSKLSNDLGFGGHETPDQGADTPVWLATHSVGIENTGKYFEHRRETVCRFSQDKESINRLYEICAEMIGHYGHK
jgi:NAD(P)-dependent dehydrogenase (short-subunit alcohol dehydrogenase family)